MTEVTSVTTSTCIERLEELVASRPNHPDVWNDLGLLRSHAGRREDALDALDRALQLNPSFDEARITRCFVLGDLGQVAEGFQELRDLRFPKHASDNRDGQALARPRTAGRRSSLVQRGRVD